MADLALFRFTSKNDLAKSLFSGWQLARKVVVNALAGDDIIQGSTKLELIRGLVVKSGAKLMAGNGNDVISGSSATSEGLKNSGYLLAGDGSDRISGLSEGRFGIYNTKLISTGEGSDSIIGRSTYGILIDGCWNGENGFWNESQINTGDGNDRIVGSSIGTGLVNSGAIETGYGNDSIKGTGGSNRESYGSYGFSWGVYNNPNCTIKTGPGNDIITGAGGKGCFGIFNDGNISTGGGDDKVNAIAGGFRGSGTTDLGPGADALIGFVGADTASISGGAGGKFIGGTGKDKILLPDGLYRIEGGLIALASGGRFMKTNSFEKIGGVNGGLFNFADGLLTITGGVATSLV
ncbi:MULTISPECIES: hypothetical protein [Aphanothece]|uniref:hypothetical protein n=1 Tax=Aphanothece TaxID=1121 RepID=UPI003984F210